MPRGKPFARIAITLPSVELAAADRLAAAQDRSRSWIVAEAVRRYVREPVPRLDATARVAAMSVPQTGVARVCRLLNDEEARYVVVGATAMGHFSGGGYPAVGWKKIDIHPYHLYGCPYEDHAEYR